MKTIQIELPTTDGDRTVFTAQCRELPTDPPKVMWIMIVHGKGMVTAFEPRPGYDRFTLNADGVYILADNAN